MAKFTIKGRVVDPAGNGIDAVTVDLIAPATNTSLLSRIGKSDSAGYFTLEVPASRKIPDSPVVVVRYLTPLPSGQFLPGGSDLQCQAVNQTLPDAHYQFSRPTVRGKVERKTGSTTQPAAGVQVELLDATKTQVDQANTELAGDFTLRAPVPGLYFLKFPAKMRHAHNEFALPDALQEQQIFLNDPTKTFPLPNRVVYLIQGGTVTGLVLTDGGIGLVGVLVEATDAHSNVLPTVPTLAGGVYQFPNVATGHLKLEFPSTFVDAAGVSRQLSGGSSSSQTVDVKADHAVHAHDVIYVEEQHVIIWDVTSGGEPAPGKIVEVLDSNKVVVDQKVTNEHGRVVFNLDDPGTYTVVVHTDDRQPAQLLQRDVVVQSIVHGRTESPNIGPPDIASSGSANSSVIDLQAFPVLTEAVGTQGMPGPAAPGAGGAGFGSIVENAIRDVLSWRPKTGDPKAFVGALNQSFDLKYVEGHVDWTWTPRSYTVQTDLGAVTGAQASIYTRAKVALDQSLPLLRGLTALRADVLGEDQESLRFVVETNLTALVNEFGVEGGPRVPRVDELFEQLLGVAVVTDPEGLKQGDLHELSDRFGLERQHVNTLQDEQNLTNYLILADYVIGLRQSWISQRLFFSRGATTEPFFGTQLVLLSRALEVVTQSVNDVYFAMDSVFLNAAERGTVQLDYAGKHIKLPFDVKNIRGGPASFTFAAGTSALFVAELLDWVDRATSDSSRLVKEAGKDGVRPLLGTIDTVRKFVRGALVPPQNPAVLTPGYQTPRVQRALQDLTNQLDEVLRLAAQIKSPKFPQLL